MNCEEYSIYWDSECKRLRICPKCDGYGRISQGVMVVGTKKCAKCKGTGKFNYNENK